MTYRIVTMPVLLLVVCLGSITTAASNRGGVILHDGQEKPTREVRLHVEGSLSPSADLDDLWEMSDLIVHATYLDARPDNRVFSLPPPEADVTLVRTAFRFHVIEAFKPRPLSFQTFEISRVGGTLQGKSEVVRYVNDKFPAFEQGQQYVLFLRRLDEGTYVAASGSPDSEFRLAGTTVVPRGRAALARALADKGIGLLDELRRRARWSLPRTPTFRSAYNTLVNYAADQSNQPPPDLIERRLGKLRRGAGRMGFAPALGACPQVRPSTIELRQQ